MRSLIPEKVLETYKVAFLPIPKVDLHQATLLDFESLPKIKVINDSIREDYIKPSLFQENEHSSILLMDKPNVHALYSLMLVQSGRLPKLSFADLSRFEKKTCFQISSLFFRYWKNSKELSEHYFPRFSFNHDPYTIHRPGLQSIQRFHAHLYLVDRIPLEKILFNSKRLKFYLPDPNYKDYFDPAAPFFEKLLIEAHQKEIALPQELEMVQLPFEEKINAGWGLGLTLLYRGDPGYFSSEQFISYLEKVDQTLHERYKNIDSYTQEVLSDLYALLRPIPRKTYEYLQRKKYLAKQILSYRDLSYSLSIDYNFEKNAFILSIYPRLFSEIGGAGLFSYQGTHCVIIRRNAERVFTESENDKRRTFQTQFLRYCDQLI